MKTLYSQISSMMQRNSSTKYLLHRTWRVSILIMNATHRDGSLCQHKRTVPVCFVVNGMEYEFDIDAATGAILEFDADLKD